MAIQKLLIRAIIVTLLITFFWGVLNTKYITQIYASWL